MNNFKSIELEIEFHPLEFKSAVISFFLDSDTEKEDAREVIIN